MNTLLLRDAVNPISTRIVIAPNYENLDDKSILRLNACHLSNPISTVILLFAWNRF